MARGLLMLVAGAALMAQEPVVEKTRAAIEAALAAQRKSIEAAAASLAAQRESVARQQEAAQKFLISPAPSLPAFSACAPLPPAQIEPMLGAAAERERMPVELLREVARQESGFRPCAVSRAGAMGVMQLMPASATRLGVWNAFDPKESVDSGARLLKEMLTRYGGDIALALSAYNAGPGRVDASGGVPEIPETMGYVRSVLGAAGLGVDEQ
jgi:soluble lytic murein transglycosylase-like protein